MMTIAKSKMMVFGILGMALGACGQSDSGGGGSGGNSGTAASSTVSGSGGSSTGGASSTTQSSGGSSAQSSRTVAGNSGTAGAKSTGGDATGGSQGGTTGTHTIGGGTTSTGAAGSGGATTTSGTGGTTGTGGATGGTGTGGKTGTGGSTGGAMGGTSAGGTTATGGTGAGGKTNTGSGTCTASKSANMSVSGSGKYKVVVETNSDSAMTCGTIYRPQDMGGAEKFPIFAWGEGACSRDGKSNSAAMAEIASHGYFVIADGPVNGGNCPSIGMPNTAADIPNMGKPLLGYLKWAMAENDKPCSAYYDSLDTTKIAADGFSCGGIMASGTSADPIMTTYGVTSSGLTSPDDGFYSKVHTPFKALVGGSSDQAYANGKRDYEKLSALGHPSVFFAKKTVGHGGDLSDKNGGDFTKVNLAWLNWLLKGDTTATGKGFLVGSGCTFCTNSNWEYAAKNVE